MNVSIARSRLAPIALLLGCTVLCGGSPLIGDAAAKPLPAPLERLSESSADNPTAVDRARALNEVGIEYAKSDKVELALNKFLESYLVFPIPSVLFNLAIANEALGEYSTAFAQSLAYRLAMNSIRAAEIRRAAETTGPTPKSNETLASIDANLAEANSTIEQLGRKLSGSLARLRLDVQPANANIRVCGAPFEAVVEGVNEVWVEPGKCTLEASAPSHESVSEMRRLEPGLVYDWSITLPTSSLGNNSAGTLELSANVPKARAFVGNAYAGETPLIGYVVAPGRHAVTIEAEGYRAFTTEVEVGQGATVHVRGELDSRSGPDWTQRDTGWTLVGAGSASLIAGAVLWGVGREEAFAANRDDDSGQRRRARDQFQGGVVMTTVGAAAGIAGAVLLIVDAFEGNDDSKAPIIQGGVDDNGAKVGMTWSF